MLTTGTLNRALTGVAKGKSFAEYGADYLSEQNSSSMGWLLNCIANLFTVGGHKKNAEAKVALKAGELKEHFPTVAYAILKLGAKSSESTASLRFGREENEFRFNTDANDVITLSAGENHVTLRQSLPELKRAVLIQYLAAKRASHPGEVIDLKDFDLSNVDLSKNPDRIDLDLSNCDFSGATLKRTDFTGRDDLQGLNFVGAKANGAIFNYANISQAKFMGAQLHSAKFESTTLCGTNFSMDLQVHANLTKATFRNSIARGAIFTRADLTNANMEGAQVAGASFQSSTMNGANINGLKASHADFSGAQFRLSNTYNDADFAHATFDGTTFELLSFKNTKFYDAAKSDEIRTQLESGRLPKRLFFNLYDFAIEHCFGLVDFDKKIAEEHSAGRLPTLIFIQLNQTGAANFIRRKVMTGDDLDPAIKMMLVKMLIMTNTTVRESLESLNLDCGLHAESFSDILVQSVPLDFVPPFTQVNEAPAEDDLTEDDPIEDASIEDDRYPDAQIEYVLNPRDEYCQNIPGLVAVLSRCFKEAQQEKNTVRQEENPVPEIAPTNPFYEA